VQSIESNIGKIKSIMEGIVKLDVPLTVSIASGRSWYDAKD
jgi:DNA polymerase I-like protein with 3'-5' exonuclease and polymerase domains